MAKDGEGELYLAGQIGCAWHDILAIRQADPWHGMLQLEVQVRDPGGALASFIREHKHDGVEVRFDLRSEAGVVSCECCECGELTVHDSIIWQQVPAFSLGRDEEADRAVGLF